MKLIVLRIVSLLAIPCLVYLSYVAGTWSLADMNAGPSVIILEKWRSDKINLNEEDWDKLREDLSYALKHDSNNPDIHEYLALAIEGRYASFAPENNEAMPFRREAYVHYKKSISIRPSWAYAWVNLALVKYRMGETDNEFYYALHKADELGSWEPGIQRVIIDIGLNYWKSQSRAEKKFVLNIIDKSLNHSNRTHSMSVLDLSKRYGVLQLVCLIHEEIEYVNQYCKRNLKKDRDSNQK
jgi:hypothetical protein